MRKKRILALFSAVILTVSLFVGCGSSSKNQGTSNTTKQSKDIKVGLSTDEGGLNDKSFNQAADEGIKKAQKELGIQYKAVESKQKEDYESNLDALVNNGDNLTFGVGFQMASAIKDEANKYKDKNFAAVDVQKSDLGGTVPKNVELLTFKEQEGSFLMGVIAGKMTKTNKIGFIGGKDYALINKFEAGFAAGVKAVNPEAAKGLISSDGKSIPQMVKYADSFSDTNKGYELAKSLYGSGCDVVYHAAGGVGIGLFKAAKEIKSSGKQVWAIGVDKDQAAEMTQYSDIILSSMIKRVDTATYTSVKDVVNGKFKGGQQIEFGLKDDGVGIAPTSNKNTPKEVLELVTKYQNAIKNGKIEVPSSRDKVSAFTVNKSAI